MRIITAWALEPHALFIRIPSKLFVACPWKAPPAIMKGTAANPPDTAADM
jgi:hypothetical protein